MAVESITLPSRLRADQGKRGLLDDMAALLNVNGNQRIATLECSILEAAKSNDDVTLPAANIDERIPRSNTSDEMHDEDDMQEANARFDFELSCGEARASPHGTIHHRAREHVFGRVECLRSQNVEALKIDDGKEDGMSRKRRRLAGVPITQRFVLFEGPHCRVAKMHGLMPHNIMHSSQADGIGAGTSHPCGTRCWTAFPAFSPSHRNRRCPSIAVCRLRQQSLSG